MMIFFILNVYSIPNNKSPIFISCEKGEFKISKYLIDKGSDIKNESNKTLLHEICNNKNYFKLVDYLLSKGANPEMTIDKILF